MLVIVEIKYDEVVIMINLANIQAYNANQLAEKYIIPPKTPSIELAVMPKEEILSADIISISHMAKQMLKAEQLDLQICCVFEGDKQLTNQEQQKKLDILGKINHVYGYPDAKPPTADKAQAEKINHQINIVIIDGQVTFEQEQRLVALRERVNLWYSAVKESTLSSEQQQQLSGLFEQLDKLHDVKPMHKEQLLKVQDMFVQLDELKGTMVGDQSGLYHF